MQEQEQLWPSREEAAAKNLRRAILEAGGNFVVEWIELGADGYFILFRRGSLVHRELGVEIAVLEECSRRDAVRQLVRRVTTIFDQK
jgi:hypothetical protein